MRLRSVYVVVNEGVDELWDTNRLTHEILPLYSTTGDIVFMLQNALCLRIGEKQSAEILVAASISCLCPHEYKRF